MDYVLGSANADSQNLLSFWGGFGAAPSEAQTEEQQGLEISLISAGPDYGCCFIKSREMLLLLRFHLV